MLCLYLISVLLTFYPRLRVCVCGAICAARMHEISWKFHLYLRMPPNWFPTTIWLIAVNCVWKCKIENGKCENREFKMKWEVCNFKFTIKCLCLSARSTNKVAIAGCKWIYVRQGWSRRRRAGRQCRNRKPTCRTTRDVYLIHTYTLRDCCKSQSSARLPVCMCMRVCVHIRVCVRVQLKMCKLFIFEAAKKTVLRKGNSACSACKFCVPDIE